MERKTLYLQDGPSRGRKRAVKKTGCTMDDGKDSSGNWMFYDRVDKKMYVITVKESGVFVASERDIMFGVNEVSRHRYNGVL